MPSTILQSGNTMKIPFLCIILILTTPVFAQVHASFTCSDSVFCSPGCPVFQCTTFNTTSIHWNFGDPASGSADSASSIYAQHCFLTGNLYTVTLTVQTNSGTATTQKVINCLATPEADFTMNITSGNAFQFTSTSVGAVTYFWSFGDPGNSYSTVQNPTFTYTGTGPYNVMLEVKGQNNCYDTMFHNTMLTGITSYNDNSKFRLYPNPSSDKQFNLDLKNEQGEVVTVEVSDPSGFIIFRREEHEQFMLLDLSSAAVGVYLLRLYKSGEIVSRKLVLTR
jgi:PKD repeat protein